jgi:hypothetical protein
MENSSKTLTPEESLELIGKFILNYKKNFRNNSFYFLLWGWMITLASISHFIILRTLQAAKEYDKIGLYSMINWIIFPLAGFVFTYFHEKDKHKTNNLRGHIDRFITTLWQVTGIAIFFELAFCLKLNHYYPGPFILTVVGLSTLVTGITIKYRPVIFGGIGFFIFAIIGSFFSNEFQLLVSALAIVLGYLVPGYMLRVSKSE